MSRRKALVIGLGETGRWASRLLLEVGFEVFSTDSEVSAADYFDGVKNFRFVPPGEAVSLLKDKTKFFDLVVVSPGVPPAFEVYSCALESAKLDSFLDRKPGDPPVVSEVELALMFQKKFLGYSPVYIAVTGTNGKSTVVDIAYRLLSSAGFPAYPVGNFGEPLSKILLEGPRVHYYVMELSSYQLERTFSLEPLSSVVLNVTPDHLYRYSSLGEYAAVKMRIHEGSAFKVLNLDDRLTTDFVRGLERDYVAFGLNFACGKPENEVFRVPVCFSSGAFFFEGRYFLDISSVSEHLRLGHNISNLLAVFSLLLPVFSNYANLSAHTLRSIADFLSSYGGLPHRMEKFLSTELGGVRIDFYDDSKSTNPDSVEKAVSSLGYPQILILGGQRKNTTYVPIFKKLAELGVVYVIFYGQGASSLIDEFEKSGVGIDYVLAEDFNDILVKVNSILSELVKVPKIKNVGRLFVLFSPGCASFDLFKNFEERGSKFKELALQRFGSSGSL